MSDSVRPHRRQPTRLPRPWDSPGKSTGAGCHFLLQCMKVKIETEVTQSCPTLVTPWTAAYQAPPSMGFSRQKYWSGVPLPSPNIYTDITKEDIQVANKVLTFENSCFICSLSPSFFLLNRPLHLDTDLVFIPFEFHLLENHLCQSWPLAILHAIFCIFRHIPMASHTFQPPC